MRSFRTAPNGRSQARCSARQGGPTRRGRTGRAPRRSRRPRPGRRCRSRASVRSPETRAGPIERIGFIEAPEIGPPNIASRPIVPPIAIAAASPTARVSVATAMITNIRNAVMTTSQRNDCASEPEGSVAPTWAMLPSEALQQRRRRDRADELSPPVPDAARRSGKCRVSVNASVTAPLKCAPGDVPDRVDHRHDHEAERDRHADVTELVRLRVDHHAPAPAKTSTNVPIASATSERASRCRSLKTAGGRRPVVARARRSRRGSAGRSPDPARRGRRAPSPRSACRGRSGRRRRSPS